MLISETESTTDVRNIKDTKRPLGKDEIEISVEDQIAISLPWERERRVRLHERLNSKDAINFAKLTTFEGYSLLRSVIGWYLYNAVPDPINTKRHLWTISCLPSTSKTSSAQRLVCLSVGNLEMLYAHLITNEDGHQGCRVMINAEPTKGLTPIDDPEGYWF